MDDANHKNLLEKNRNHYCWEYVSQDTAVDFSFRRTKQIRVKHKRNSHQV